MQSPRWRLIRMDLEQHGLATVLFPDRKYFVRRHLRENSRHAVGLERAAGHVELVIDESRHEPVPGDLHVRKDLPGIRLRVVGFEGPEGHLAPRFLVFAAGDIEFAVVDGAGDVAAPRWRPALENPDVDVYKRQVPRTA